MLSSRCFLILSVLYFSTVLFYKKKLAITGHPSKLENTQPDPFLVSADVLLVWGKKSCGMCSLFTRRAISRFVLDWWVYWGMPSWIFRVRLMDLLRYHSWIWNFHYRLRFCWFVDIFLGLGLHKWKTQERSTVPGRSELVFIWSVLCFKN